MSITFFFSSALSLPAIRCPDNFSSKSWLCIPQSIAIHQSLVSLSKKSFKLNGQLHFLEPMLSRFGFFLVLGGLYIPLLSHCIVKYDLFITDLSIQTANLALTPCQRTQSSNSSRSLHLAFVVKNEAVSRPSQTTLIGTGLGSWTLNGFTLMVGLTSPEVHFWPVSVQRHHPRHCQPSHYISIELKKNYKGRINKSLVEQVNQEQKWRKKFKKHDCTLA